MSVVLKRQNWTIKKLQQHHQRHRMKSERMSSPIFVDYRIMHRLRMFECMHLFACCICFHMKMVKFVHTTTIEPSNNINKLTHGENVSDSCHLILFIVCIITDKFHRIWCMLCVENESTFWSSHHNVDSVWFDWMLSIVFVIFFVVMCRRM